MIEIQADIKALRGMAEKLKAMPGALEMSMYSAASGSQDYLRTLMTKEIAYHSYLKPAYIRKSMYSQLGYQNSTLLIRGRRSSLGSYLIRPKNAPRKRKAPGYLTGAVRRDRGITRFSKGFILEHNNLAVLREGPGKHGSFQGLHVLTGPSVAQVAEWIANEDLAEIKDMVNERYMQLFRKNVNAFAKGFRQSPRGGFAFSPESKNQQLMRG